MPKIVNEIPPKCKGLYPWPEWLDGKKRLLVKGTDFQTDLKKIASLAYQAAKRHKVAIVVRIRTDENGIYLQANPSNPQKKAAKPRRKK